MDIFQGSICPTALPWDGQGGNLYGFSGKSVKITAMNEVLARIYQ
jgi:hypothetical protein